MLPWISWQQFIFGTATPGNGGPLLQPRGQTSVFYSVPPPLHQQEQQGQQGKQGQQQLEQGDGEDEGEQQAARQQAEDARRQR
jgi:hypothetical protein